MSWKPLFLGWLEILQVVKLDLLGNGELNLGDWALEMRTYLSFRLTTAAGRSAYGGYCCTASTFFVITVTMVQPEPSVILILKL